MTIKFRYNKDKLVCNDLTISSIDLMIRLIESYLLGKLSFDKLREYNPLYSVPEDGRPNYILCGPGIYYVINHSKSSVEYDISTYTDRFFWEVYSNPGPYQRNNFISMINRLKELASKSLNELRKSKDKYKF